MNWEYLKEYKCPKCGTCLKQGSLYYCEFCTFSISKGKLYNIAGAPLDLEKEANKLLFRGKRARAHLNL